MYNEMKKITLKPKNLSLRIRHAFSFLRWFFFIIIMLAGNFVFS